MRTSFCKRYVDDNLANLVRDHYDATVFLARLIKTIPIRIQRFNSLWRQPKTINYHHLETSVLRKNTKKGLLLHYHSHVRTVDINDLY